MDELNYFLQDVRVNGKNMANDDLGRFANPQNHAIKEFDLKGVTIIYMPISFARKTNLTYKIYSDSEFSLYIHSVTEDVKGPLPVLFNVEAAIAYRFSVMCAGGRLISFECLAPRHAYLLDEKFCRYLCAYAGTKIDICKKISSPYGVDMFTHVRTWDSIESFERDIDRLNSKTFHRLTFGDAEITTAAIVNFRAHEWGFDRLHAVTGRFID